MFARRTEFGHETDDLLQAVAERRASGMPLLDLTESNPTHCGLGMPAAELLPPLADAASLVYRAEPFGPAATRRCIAEEYYGSRGVDASADDLLLTASTSEAYSYLFRLLCDPGDIVLVPQPSYPLFDLLARFCDVQLQTYPLRWQDRWEVDLDALESAITPRTKAIVVVHPNNPTGHYASSEERHQLDALAARANLPLLVDEVFLDYAVEADGQPQSFAHGSASALTFVMSGLSKVLALPQMKLAWTLVCGPEHLRHEALRRLEFIADTWLSVSTPVAHAACDWLCHTAAVQQQVRHRVRHNLEVLDGLLQKHPFSRRLPVEGGWSALLRIPAVGGDADLAHSLLHDEGVLLYPGSFFGTVPQGWWVISLLPTEEAFAEAVGRLLGFISRRCEEASW